MGKLIWELGFTSGRESVPLLWLSELSLANTRCRETWPIWYKIFLQALVTSLAWFGLEGGQMYGHLWGCQLKKGNGTAGFFWPSSSQTWIDWGLWRDKAAHAGAVGLQIFFLESEILDSCDLGGTWPGPPFPTPANHQNPSEAQSNFCMGCAEGQHVSLRFCEGEMLVFILFLIPV